MSRSRGTIVYFSWLRREYKWRKIAEFLANEIACQNGISLSDSSEKNGEFANLSMCKDII